MTQEIVANKELIEDMLHTLLETYEDWLNENIDKVTLIDALMGVHNFHVYTVLDIEKRFGNEPKDQLLIRDTAVNSFKMAMETKPPLTGEPVSIHERKKG